MKGLEAPEYMTFYVLISQASSSLLFSTAGTTIGQSYGTGFYGSRDDAEKARTFALLNDKTDTKFHIFELEFPNPAYKSS